MTDAGLALDVAIRDALRIDPTVRMLCAGRIYDVVPAAAAMPYVELGAGQVLAQPADGQERAVEVYATLHAYSRERGRPEVKKLAGALVDALDGAELDLADDLRLVLIRHEDTRVLTEPDGLTHHGVVTFRALIDPA